MLLGAAPAFAEDDDEPARDEGIVSNLMRGLGASDGSSGINYRERSPLVVPRQLTLILRYNVLGYPNPIWLI